MTKTILTKQAYAAPDTSVVEIRQERCFMDSTGYTSLADLEYNGIYEEDF